MAHALHDLIEVQKKTEIVGRELLEALIKRVHFEGVTGLVDFHDASADADRLYHGDRRVGVSYKMLNYVDDSLGLVMVVAPPSPKHAPRCHTHLLGDATLAWL